MKRWIYGSLAGVLALSTLAMGGPAEAKGGRGDGGGAGRMGGGRAGGGGAERLGRQRGGPDISVQRHRDRDGDGRGDRHRRPRWRSYYPWWPSYGGFYSGFGYRSPFYDPFYQPFYPGYREREDRDGDGKSSGNVEVKVSPKDAEIYANGVRYGKSRARFSLPAGPWKIELRAPGHVPQAIDLDVQPGIKYSIERKLDKDQTLAPDGKPLKAEEI